MLLEPQRPGSIQVAGTPCVWKLNFWSFLTNTKPDQAFPSHVQGKIWPHSTQFRVIIFFISHFFLVHPVYFDFKIPIRYFSVRTRAVVQVHETKPEKMQNWHFLFVRRSLLQFVKLVCIFHY